jgi:class 3 adenylate cyclase
MGLHTGKARLSEEDYFGLDVHRAARICAVAHGGQVLVSETTIRALAGQVIDGILVRDLGEHRLRDLSCPLRLHQIVADGLFASGRRRT